MDFANFRKTLVSPALRAIADHWNEARGSALMPSWEQLQPARMAPYLSILWAYKYDAPNDRFIGRLAGGAVAWGFQKNFRGLVMQDAWPPDVAAQVHQMMLRMIGEPKICRKTGNLFKQAGRFVEGERIALPLASDGVHGDGLLGASFYKHPLRSLDQGSVELLTGDEEWFSLRSAAPVAGVSLEDAR